MNTNEVRTAYLEFLRERGHAIIPSASLLPENDPTTLFTGSGMQPLLPYLLGAPHPQGRRLTDSQKCFRAEDIDEVGDNRHTTFFEMLGNWSLGEYFKEEQLRWFFEFLTSSVGLDPENLYVTVFAGDEQNGIARDTESVEIWKTLFAGRGIAATDVELLTEERGGDLGMQGGRIFYYDAKKNWWSRAGIPENMPAGEPGGPDSEVFYDFKTEHDPAFGEHCHPNCDCGRFMEIGNSVFMQYLKQADGTFAELPQKNVDFGGGLERITAASNNNPDVFLIDVFKDVIKVLERNGTYTYPGDESWTTTSHMLSSDQVRKSYRILVDHLRGAVFMIADGVLPSKSDQGYVLRRLIRRLVLHADRLGLEIGTLNDAIVQLIESYRDFYPYLANNEVNIHKTFIGEENKFRSTLQRGLKEFEKRAGDQISGNDAFTLVTTYGFPIELIKELSSERGLSIDLTGFEEEMKQHQERSRLGAQQKFKGGLADHSDMTVRYHTATHLLHQALRDVLGDGVEQRGSNITPERLRFDFTFDRKMTDEEKEEVTRLVNEKISQALPVSYEDLPLEEAKKRGAIGLFEEKYGDTVRVYSVGAYSLEFCGGPHVSNTNKLGKFSIAKEESISAGVRRIKAHLK